ncbi:MAG: hypothetical protein U5L72_14990 [Bacteroidales bacterium]|nr:hypothetical protein [Bacteroidales bacterium]
MTLDPQNFLVMLPAAHSSHTRCGAEGDCQRLTSADAGSGERMMDATVYEKASFAGTTTNNYGFYSLPLSPGKSEIIGIIPGL